MQISTEFRTNPVTGRVPTPFHSAHLYICPIHTLEGKFELSRIEGVHPIDSHQESAQTPTNRQEVDLHRPAEGEVYVTDLTAEASKHVTYRGDVDSQKSALVIRYLRDVLLYIVGGAYVAF